MEEIIYVVFDEVGSTSEGNCPNDTDSEDPLNVLKNSSDTNDEEDSQGPGSSLENEDSADH